MVLNFKNLILKDIEGNELNSDGFYKSLANIIYHKASVLDEIEVARKINSGEDKEYSDEELKLLKAIVTKKETELLAFVQVCILDFINS